MSLGEGFESQRQRMAAILRKDGINVDVYGGEASLKKQLKYADRGLIPLAIFYGANEAVRGVVRIKVLQQEHPNQDEHIDVPFSESGVALLQKIHELVARLRAELPEMLATIPG